MPTTARKAALVAVRAMFVVSIVPRGWTSRNHSTRNRTSRYFLPERLMRYGTGSNGIALSVIIVVDGGGPGATLDQPLGDAHDPRQARAWPVSGQRRGGVTPLLEQGAATAIGVLPGVGAEANGDGHLRVVA